ncbi:hypothetical protein BESB_000880 [Besnoitia besnoiti]|uniref:Uncharacterized protein n=1 Tax=Besnoitia besnoiti TaxID=94643 RepID=A0A2A9MNF4_BESBE|nr:hypothetical protein BESB_000880 [Besnoitia besnoiti]PFH37746.1 hypothetical protein BESB_000880 [Besnoitia besnoiti]
MRRLCRGRRHTSRQAAPGKRAPPRGPPLQTKQKALHRREETARPPESLSGSRPRGRAVRPEAQGTGGSARKTDAPDRGGSCAFTTEQNPAPPPGGREHASAMRTSEKETPGASTPFARCRNKKVDAAVRTEDTRMRAAPEEIKNTGNTVRLDAT